MCKEKKIVSDEKMGERGKEKTKKKIMGDEKKLGKE